jgi:predicted nucleic acid-binding protein
LSYYLDTSVIVPLFLDDSHTNDVRCWLRTLDQPIKTSLWTSVEFSSVSGVYLRRGIITPDAQSAVELAFDEWMARQPSFLAVLASDYPAARLLVKRLELSLRGPDALHIAIARRHGLGLATCDQRMAAAARALRMDVAEI